MTSFLLLLLPITILIYCLWTKNLKNLPLIFIGFCSAVIVCLFKFFFTYSHRLVYLSFSANFAFYFVRQTLLPVLILCGIFYLFSKDTWEFKLNGFFPLVGSFYTVSLPYSVIGAAESFYTGYDLFLKPMIYLAMLLQIAMSLHYIYKNMERNKKVPVVIDSLLILIYLVVPAIFDTAFAIDCRFMFILIGAVIFFAVPLAYVVYTFIKSLKDKKQQPVEA